MPDGTAQCEVCIEHTVLYEHECFACPRALIALNAIEQEEELEVELEDQRLRQIECELRVEKTRLRPPPPHPAHTVI